MANKPPVKSITLFCVNCTQEFKVNSKDNKGLLIRQQVCPHTILESVEYGK